MSRRSHAAIARAAGLDRTLLAVLGGMLLVGGAAAVLVSTGALGVGRAGRPVLDPIVVRFLAEQQVVARVVTIVVGVLLTVLGLAWAWRALRPEPRPDVVLDVSPGGLTVTSGALADAVRTDAETVPGVQRARARVVGSRRDPALRVTLWLHEGTDLRAVWEHLDRDVLARARSSLGIERLPTAVHVELEAAKRPRVT